MAVTARDGYVDVEKDAVERFHGNQIVYIDWDRHRLYSSALAFPVPPEMPFSALTDEIIPGVWGSHPQFGELDWSTVQWVLDDAPLRPVVDASLADNSIGHKSLLRFVTPGLDGIAGSGN